MNNKQKDLGFFTKQLAAAQNATRQAERREMKVDQALDHYSRTGKMPRQARAAFRKGGIW
jgi:hypothetical protein